VSITSSDARDVWDGQDRDHEHCCHSAPWSHPLNFVTLDFGFCLT
jgi:hypothetical protein